MLKMAHRLAHFDPQSVSSWHQTLGDPKTYQMAVRILGRDALPALDDVIHFGGSDTVEE